jgi:capsid protein
MEITTSYPLWELTTNYLQGAKVTTAGKPLFDGNIDNKAGYSASKIRKQTHYLNANGTDIPSIVSKSTNRTIGVSVNIQIESPDEKFNESAEKWIKKFKKIGQGELTGKHHFNSAARAISDFDKLDGGVIIRHHYNIKWEMPYKYELVPVDMIDVGKNDNILKQEGQEEYTLNGLVYNKWNQITHVWIYNNSNKMTSTKVSMKNITYYSDVWASINQQTAISRLTSILPTLDQIDQYGKASLESAIESAKGGAYLKSTAYSEIMQVLQDAIKQEIATSKTDDKVGVAIDITTPILKRLANAGIKPVGLTPIPHQDEVSFDNRNREGVYAELNKNAEMKMGSASGMSDMSVYSKANEANYSAMKYVSETDQISADIRFDNFTNKIFDEIISRAILIGVQIGEIKSRQDYFKNPSSYENYRYLRQIFIDIEPSKTAEANKTNIELGLKTEGKIIETRDGVKYEDFLADKIKQNKKKIDADLEVEKYRQEQIKKLNLQEVKNENSAN